MFLIAHLLFDNIQYNILIQHNITTIEERREKEKSVHFSRRRDR